MGDKEAMTGRFANIIVDISHEKVDRPFQYRIPEALIGKLTIGMAVIIPFGLGNKRMKGYVMEITDRVEYDEKKLKYVDSIVKDGVSARGDSLRLAWWIRENYGSTMIAALKTVLPVKKKLKQVVKKTIVCKVDMNTAAAKAEEFAKKNQNAKARLMQELATQPVLPYTLVTGKLNVTSQTIQALEKAALVEVQAEDTYRNVLPERMTELEGWKKKQLSANQSAIVTNIIRDFKAGDRKSVV